MVHVLEGLRPGDQVLLNPPFEAGSVRDDKPDEDQAVAPDMEPDRKPDGVPAGEPVTAADPGAGEAGQRPARAAAAGLGDASGEPAARTAPRNRGAGGARSGGRQRPPGGEQRP
jgi:hypothetical protein